MNTQNNSRMNDRNNRNRKEQRTYVDYDIFRGDIRLITPNGGQVVIDRDEAISEAKAMGMNLVQVSYSKSSFPHAICKIIDYGKYKFEQKKREKENAKKSRLANAEAKEIFFSIRIDDGDKNNKIKHIREFLSENSKVRIVIKLSRREMRVKYMAKDLMDALLKELSNDCVLDNQPSMSDNIMSCIVRPMKKDIKVNPNKIVINVK